MASVSKSAVIALVSQYKQQGLGDKQILMKLMQRPDDIGKNVQTLANRKGLETAGQLFGLDVSRKASDKTVGDVNKNASFMDKVKSTAVSGAMGLADFGAGIVQGGYKLTDTLGITDHAYDDYNKTYEKANGVTQVMRQEAGRSGIDLTREGTKVALSVPFVAAGGGATLLARAGVQGAIGAGLGTAHYAKDGKDRAKNIGWGAVGGAAGQGVSEKIIAPLAGKVATSLTRSSANKTGQTATSATKLVDDAIADTGIATSHADRQVMINQATKALAKGNKQDATAMVRQTLLKNNGIKGTQAQISRNPAKWGEEREFAKLDSAGSKALNGVHIENHKQLDDLMKSLVTDTGATGKNTRAKMEDTFSTLTKVNDEAKSKIGSLYETARNMGGVDTKLNHMRFINNATAELEHNMLGSFVKGDAMKTLKGMFERPEFAFTLGKSEEFVKVINKRLRETTDGNERAALGIIRSNLEKEIGDTADDLAGALPHTDSLGATKAQFDEARGTYKDHAQTIEKTPALKAAIDEVAPDKAFSKYVVNADTRDLIALTDVLKKSPQGSQNIADLQGATIEHFLNNAKKANNGAFSPSQLASTIDSFGEDKLKVLFSPEQRSRLKDIRQVADILIQQPLGSHVNHSNPANVVIKQLLGLTGGLARVPGVGTIGNLVLGGAKTASDLTKSGKAYRMMEGEIPTLEKNTTFGLTADQLKRIGIAKNTSATTGATLGTNMGVN